MKNPKITTKNANFDVLNNLGVNNMIRVKKTVCQAPPPPASANFFATLTTSPLKARELIL
jgi:PKD repeat protein